MYFKYQPGPSFRLTIIASKTFDTLWKHISWSIKTLPHPEFMSYAEHRWMLVDGLVEISNYYIVKMMSPFHRIYLDGSIYQ